MEVWKWALFVYHKHDYRVVLKNITNHHTIARFQIIFMRVIFIKIYWKKRLGTNLVQLKNKLILKNVLLRKQQICTHTIIERTLKLWQFQYLNCLQMNKTWIICLMTSNWASIWFLFPATYQTYAKSTATSISKST